MRLCLFSSSFLVYEYFTDNNLLKIGTSIQLKYFLVHILETFSTLFAAKTKSQVTASVHDLWTVLNDVVASYQLHDDDGKKSARMVSLFQQLQEIVSAAARRWSPKCNLLFFFFIARPF